MEDNFTQPVSTRVSQEVVGMIIQEINGTKKSMAEWVREAIEEKLTNDNKDKIDQEIKHHEEALESLRKKKESFTEKEKTFSKIPEKEISFLIETKKIIDEDFTFIQGRINLYKNKFHKGFKISEQDFIELLNKACEQSKEKCSLQELEVESS